MCSFFFHVPPTTHISTLSLHDALPISEVRIQQGLEGDPHGGRGEQQRQEVQQREDLAVALMPGHEGAQQQAQDRKSTRLNSSHVAISYAVFCLKKKKKKLECIEIGQPQ